MQRKYKVTFDNIGGTEIFEGATLMREGLLIRLDEERISELFLFEEI